MSDVLEIARARRDARVPPRPRRGVEMTEEQRAEVKSLIESMQENDATRKEIRTAVNELLASWGIEPPEGVSGE